MKQSVYILEVHHLQLRYKIGDDIMQTDFELKNFTLFKHGMN